MVTLKVILERGELTASVVTERTLVRFLACVDSAVDLKALSCAKALPTHRALLTTRANSGLVREA